MDEGLLDFGTCLDLAKRIHGNSCARLAVGTRMAIAGLKAIGIEDPRGRDSSNIMAFVEIDRCVSDAVMAVTGCRPGKRTLRIVDYGKVAATFLNLETGKAMRLSVKGGTGEDSWGAPSRVCRSDMRIKPYMGLPDRQLFHMEEVCVTLRPQDMPGNLLWVALCEQCGEFVMDMRDVHKNGRALCRPCAKGASYYRVAKGRAGEG